MQSEKSVSWLLAGAVLLALSSAATAQQPPNEVPQRTTATYANWVLTCDTQAGPPPRKICQILQMVQAQAQAGQDNAVF